ncbi:MAG: hypothetical protein ACREC0_02095 [Methylocella sp.]
MKQRIGGLFRRAEPRPQVGLYLEGLTGGVEPKNGWQLAEHAGGPAPCRMQALLGRTFWGARFGMKSKPALGYVIERLGDPSGVLVLDETGILKTGFFKKGIHSVGVARQYSGAAGGTREMSDWRGPRLCGSKRARVDRPPSLFARRLYLPAVYICLRSGPRMPGV